MEYPLLKLKFHIPQLKANLITRQRLLSLLDEGLNKKLVVLSAPAGFGKSTLLSDWLGNVPCPYAWLSLDEEDNDPARFLTYLVAALQRLDPNIDDTVLNLLQSPQPDLPSAAITALINQIDDIETEAILVLDDFHTITNPSIHQSIEYILSYLPVKFHLVISTRADPPFAYSLLRAQGELVEVRMNHLKFTDEEAQAYLVREIGHELPEQVLAELIQRTEGWISGLKMASLSLLGAQDKAGFIKSFSGIHRFILDYLFEEVLKQQPAEIQQFLLYTSGLDRMSGELCDQILERTDCQAVLERLEKSNLFLVSLDDERRWYRYHQLFKDLLSHHLMLEHQEVIPRLHGRASLWHEQEGQHPLAIEYALRAGDSARAADLVLEEAEKTLMRGEVKTYQKWVEALPDKLLDQYPRIKFFNLWSQIIAGADLGKSLSQFKYLAPDVNAEGRILALQAFIQISQGNFLAAGDSAEQALARLEPGDSYFRSLAVWIKGVFHALQQDVQGAVGMLENLSASHDFQKYPMLHIMLLSQIAHAHSRIGHLDQAEQIYQQALGAAKDKQGNWIPIAGEVLMGYGDLLRERNQLDQAADLILDGIELTQQWRRAAAIEGYIFLARVKQLQNNFPSAGAALEKAMELAVEYDVISIDDRLVSMWQARLWCFEGKLDLVEDWIERQALSGEVDAIVVEGIFHIENYLLARENLVLARYHLLREHYQQSLSLIKRLLAVFEGYGRLDFLIELKLLRALNHWRRQEIGQALSALGEAIDLSRQGGFLSFFLEAGPEMKVLIQQYSKGEPLPVDLQQLLEDFRAQRSFPEGEKQQFVDPLSDRELDVLKYLPTNLTTPEIADEMMISNNTVRTHIKNIYQKLGVHKRSEAVNRSQDLKLIG